MKNIAELATDIRVDDDGITLTLPGGIYSMHSDDSGNVIVDEFYPISEHGVN